MFVEITPTMQRLQIIGIVEKDLGQYSSCRFEKEEKQLSELFYNSRFKKFKESFPVFF